MDSHTVLIFTSNGMGKANADLQATLAKKFLGLVIQCEKKPGRICFYTEGVKLACEGSPVLDLLATLERSGVELILCKTCLDHFGLHGRIKVGIVGGMPDILEAMAKAQKVISL
jgi:sulfur relay (sulfurtransferase) complex TusBCD TusD component (DsrE family)